MNFSIQQSENQAELIKKIGVPIMLLDIEYCTNAAKELLKQAHRQEAMAVLNPSYPQIKNDIIRTQAQALLHLCDYARCLKEVIKLQSQLFSEKHTMDNINNMFI